MSRVIWGDRGWMPYHYGFCPNEKAWYREMKRFGFKDLPPYPGQLNASFTHFKAGKNHDACGLVTVDTAPRPASQVVGLLVHEGMHIWRRMRRMIGERKPSQEFEAYAMQAIAQNLISAYERTRGPLMLKGNR